jgi:hypothetical protein
MVALLSSIYSTKAMSFFAGITRTSNKFSYLRMFKNALTVVKGTQYVLREESIELIFGSIDREVLNEENFVGRKVLVRHLDDRFFRSRRNAFRSSGDGLFFGFGFARVRVIPACTLLMLLPLLEICVIVCWIQGFDNGF